MLDSFGRRHFWTTLVSQFGFCDPRFCNSWDVPERTKTDGANSQSKSLKKNSKVKIFKNPFCKKDWK